MTDTSELVYPYQDIFQDKGRSGQTPEGERDTQRERAPREKDRKTGLWFQGQPGSNKNRRVHPGTGGNRDCQEGYPFKTEGRRVRGDRRKGRVKDIYCQNDNQS
jgi:hypothetical protein